ncbi:MAG: thymidine phosphorylase, partial [Oscillospiraceae bacterium]|nr:thymidine phosphorylase [Oscillospiraceae bacterium]
KVGDGAFMKDEESAEKLARLMISVGEAAGQKCSAVLTDMSKPLGYTVGNAVEVVEAIEALHGKDVPSFHEVAYEISAQMLLLSGYGTEDECRAAVENAVKSGAALERMRTMIALQGGDARICDDPSLLGEIHKAKTEYPVYAQQDGYISGISCEKTGMVSLKLGAGRENKTDPIDMSAGIVFNAFVGDHVKKGDLLATLRTSRDIDIEDIASEFSAVFGYCENEVIKRKNVIKVIKSC